ncbi:hypothetical protein MferCBS31731_002422 [Microsporum ferrugineum]
MPARDVEEIFNVDALEGIDLSFPNPFRKLAKLFKKRNKGKERAPPKPEADRKDITALTPVTRKEFRPLDICRQGWGEPLHPYPERGLPDVASMPAPRTPPPIVISACDRPDPGPSYPTTLDSRRSIASESTPSSVESSPVIHIPDSPPVIELALPAPAFSKKDLVAIFGNMVHAR